MLNAATPLKPKNPDGKLVVVAIGRISTPGQNVENIDASHEYVKEHLRRIYDGPVDLTLLGEQASGMLVDRATIREAEDLVAGGTVDLIIAEDLARIYRNPRHQYNFVQDCVDAGTRVICVGDNLDTGDEGWEVNMGAAALRHGLYIPDTRRRVRRTATHSFYRGGMVQKTRYGYRKLSADEANSAEFGPKGLRIAKVPEATPVIRQMVQRVMGESTYAAIADWLNRKGIAPGPYVLGGQWTARLVVELLDDPILSGTRSFRKAVYRPIYRTGKHQAIKNDSPETEHCPELAHLDKEEHEAVRQEIARRRAAHPTKNSRSGHRQHYSPRSRTLWPGQSIVCGVCGALMYYMGSHLKCRNTLTRRRQTCWNHVQVPVGLTRERVIDWLMGRLDGIPDGRDILSRSVWELLKPATSGRQRQAQDLEREILSLEKQAGNLTAAIAEGGQLAALVERLKLVEVALKKARRKKAQQRSRSQKDGDCVGSAADVAKKLNTHLRSLMGRSYEFAALMRQMLPEFTIQPVQAFDTDQVRPRAKFILRLAALHAGGKTADCHTSSPSDVAGRLDLFEPPLHIRHMAACVAAKREQPGLSLKKIAALLGTNHMAVKRALDLSRRMRFEGLCDPYRELDGPPQRASRWRKRLTRA